MFIYIILYIFLFKNALNVHQEQKRKMSVVDPVIILTTVKGTCKNGFKILWIHFISLVLIFVVVVGAIKPRM